MIRGSGIFQLAGSGQGIDVIPIVNSRRIRTRVFVRPSRAGQCVGALTRTNSLTRRDQGKRYLITFSELCPSWNKSDAICLLGINMQTFAVICNSAIWAVSLCVSAHRHRVPFLGIQPSNVSSIGSLDHMHPFGPAW